MIITVAIMEMKISVMAIIFFTAYCAIMNITQVRKEGIDMEIKSVLIKDTTKEERIRIVQEGLNQCGGACDFCNGCDNLGGGSVDAFYEPYINGEKELRQINEEYRSNSGMVK